MTSALSPKLPAGVRVRDAREEDAEAIHALYHAAYAVHEDPHRPPTAGLKDTVEDVRSYLRDSRILVAEDETGRLVATIGLRRLAHLRRLAVAPGLKGEGLGALMLEAALEAAREEGFRVAELGTFPDHPWLAPFYRRHGFADYSVETMPDGTRWLQMRRRLD